MQQQKRRLNWIREKEPLDGKFIKFPFHPAFSLCSEAAKVVKAVDWRSSIMPPIVNQGNEGSCTYNAWAYLLGGLELKDIQAHVKSPLEFDPSKFSAFSRQFGYYGERVLMGTVNEDSGATLSVGLQASQKWGCCAEPTWPYSSNMFHRPSVKAYNEASLHKPLVGYHLDNTNLNQLKACLLGGYPFVFGISVYESFLSVGSDGIVPVPDPSSEQYEGGHALACFGYDDSINGGSFIVPNSWGNDWGDNGVCYIPYGFLTDSSLAADFLTARG